MVLSHCLVSGLRRWCVMNGTVSSVGVRKERTSHNRVKARREVFFSSLFFFLFFSPPCNENASGLFNKVNLYTSLFLYCLFIYGVMDEEQTSELPADHRVFIHNTIQIFFLFINS